MRGVHRPALAVVIPVPGKPFLLLDAGANVEGVRPEMLGPSSRTWARRSWRRPARVASPRVALLAERDRGDKGTEVVVTAHTAPGARR